MEKKESSCSGCGSCCGLKGGLKGCGFFKAVFKTKEPEKIIPLSKPLEVSDSSDAEILVIKGVNPCINENGLEHHTEKYELMKRGGTSELVVRRGQSFKLILDTNRPYDAEKDGISFIFTVADEDRPSHGQGTLVPVPLLASRPDGGGWLALVESAAGNSLTVLVTPSANCVVAPWKMEIDTKLKTGGELSYSYPTNIYVLYNPWCKEDNVYMEDKVWREECTLADTGLIWRGGSNQIQRTGWRYAQFEQDILECSFYLVHRLGRVNGSARADPVRTTRALSAAVNSNDDNGCVMGNWSGKYEGGEPPTKWIGSMEILQKYYKEKKPVRYGQCWVFAGVLSTVCRAIGIPSRPVSNFNSAHDTQSSLTVDYFVDEENEAVEDLNSDSIWNFHVWSEAWMSRPDLGPDYGGWQAIDATPQERSERMFQCGPASVVAVKRGEVMKPYDGTFLFAEVNADKITWRYTGTNQPLKLLGKDILGIGKLISTKAAGKWEREDLTEVYKFAEHTTEERTVMLNALRQTENVFSRYYLNEDFNDVHFNFELRDDIIIGQPFDVVLVMRNRSKTKGYTVNTILKVDTTFYTGQRRNMVKKETSKIEIKGGGTERITMKVTYEEYVNKLFDQSAFIIACLATIEGTKFEYYAQDDFRVRKPDIKVRLVGNAVQGREMTAELKLINPLPVPLRKGEFTVQGPGLNKQMKMKLPNVVPAGGTASTEVKFTPPTSGHTTIMARFTSKELDDVDGMLNFVVTPKMDVNSAERGV